MATINEMRQVATQIETETQVGGNTAGRVGGLFNDIVDKLEDDEANINIVQRVEITYKQCQIPNKYINDTNVGSALSLQSNNDYGVFYFFVRKGQSFAISSTYVAPSASRLYIFHLDEDLDIVQRYENVVVGTTTYTATEDCIVVGTLYGNDSIQYTGIQKAYLVNGKMNEVGLTGANIIQHLKDLEADIDNDITNLNTEVGSLENEVFGTPSVSNLPLSNNGVLNANGTISLYEDWYNSDYFAVDSAKQYTYNGSIYGGGNILYYDSAKNLLGACSNIPVNYADRTVPVGLNDMPSNAAYIRVSGYDISACSITESDSLRPKVEKIEERIDNLIKPQGIIEPVFSATLGNPVRIKLLGDSITQGWGGSNFDQDGAEIYPLGEGWQTHRNLHGYCWANMMRDYLETKYHCTVVNNAITGTSTRNIVTRLDDFIDAADDIVICAYGTNNRNNYDGNNTEWNSFVPDLFTIVNYCKERNKTIILVANIPASSANEQSTDNGHAKSAHMNDVHDAVLYVAESTGVECVDMYDAFNDYCINTNTSLGVLLGDGLHPNDNGYDVYYSLIMPRIGVAIESAAESGGVIEAGNIKYDNSQSGLAADNVQGALDEFGEVSKRLNIPITSTVVTMPSTTVDGVMTDFTKNPAEWKEQSLRKLYFVPYTYRAGDYLVVTANNSMEADFVFLSSSNHVVGSPIDLAGNQTSLYIVPAGESNAANPQKIPSDCTYILINGYYSTNNFTPASVEIVNHQFVSDYAVEVNKHADNNTLLIDTLASECQDKDIEHSYTTEAFMGQWQDNGTIGTTAAKRAHLKLPTIGFNKLKLSIPTNYYAQLYYVDSNNVSVSARLLEWQNGTITVDIDGQYDIMLNIKYQSAGTTSITNEMLAGVMWGVTLYNDEGYEPAAPYSNLVASVGGDHVVGRNEFVQGSENGQGEIVKTLVRCITYQKYDVDANSVVTVNNNGQAHVMITYDADGNYEGTTGWITANSSFTYTFTSAKKVQFVVSWDGGTSTTIVPDQVAVGITIHYKGRLGVLEENMGDSTTTKANDSFCRFNKKISVYNPYKNHPTNQYKGQMHCHTTNSDGALAPAAVVAKYVGYGYDFMTITDHNYITPNPSPNADIVWMGNSYEDTWNAAGHQHMNVWNCTEVINKVNQYTTSNTPQMLVNHYVKEGDSVLSYNHPEYPAVYASDATLAGLPVGISFVEIYNSTIQTYLGEVDSLPSTANFGDMVTYNGTRYINTSITKASPNWQATTEEAEPNGNLDRGFRIMLDQGHKVFCDAVDDFHSGDNMENRGWMMVFANSRTRQSIWNGLLMGASYASTGVSLNNVSFVDGVFRLDIANEESAVTTFYGYNNEVLGTSNGTTAIYEVTGDEKYVRAMVEIDGKKAWTQPVWIISVGEQYEF